MIANTPLHVVFGHNSVEVVKFNLNMGRLETVELEGNNIVCVTKIQLGDIKMFSFRGK